MEINATHQLEPKKFASGLISPNLLRTIAGLFVGATLLAACGSTTTEVASDLDTPAIEEVAEAEETTTTTTEDAEVVEEAAVVEAPEDGGSPEGEAPEGERPARPDEEGSDDANTLTDGPQNVGEHGPLSNADLNGDETVTIAELETFMDGALEREIGLVAFFAIYDLDTDEILDADELATVDPDFAFDGTDSNEDGLVSLEEVNAYANEEGRSYRAIGLPAFFDLVDTDGNAETSPEEIEAAHVSGLLARF